MIRILLFFSLFGFMGSSVLAAGHTPEELENNYKVCAQADEDWVHDWGQYVVSFDLGAAYDICRKEYEHFKIGHAGCRVNKTWIYAGYYCSEEMIR